MDKVLFQELMARPRGAAGRPGAVDEGASRADPVGRWLCWTRSVGLFFVQPARSGPGRIVRVS